MSELCCNGHPWPLWKFFQGGDWKVLPWVKGMSVYR